MRYTFLLVETYLCKFEILAKVSEAEADMDMNLGKNNLDIALYETNRELESQRLELYSAHHWADQAHSEKIDFCGDWKLAGGTQPAPTCKRAWNASGGHRRDFMVSCTLAAAAVLFCKVQPDRWVAPHLAVRTLFDCGRWTCRVTQPVQRTPLWPASWLLAVDKSRGSKSVEVQSVFHVEA